MTYMNLFLEYRKNLIDLLKIENKNIFIFGCRKIAEMKIKNCIKGQKLYVAVLQFLKLFDILALRKKLDKIKYVLILTD